ASAPRSNGRTEAQSTSLQTLRRSCRPATTCRTSTQGTTSIGSSTRLSNGTAARAEPKPGKPRRKPASAEPTSAKVAASGVKRYVLCRAGRSGDRAWRRELSRAGRGVNVGRRGRGAGVGVRRLAFGVAVAVWRGRFQLVGGGVG